MDGLGTMGGSEPHEAGFFSSGSSTLPSGITSSTVPRCSSAAVAGRPSANMFFLCLLSKSLQLIMLFFSGAGIIFPMVDRPSFIQKYHDAKRNEFKAVQKPWLCLLNTIFAVASRTSKPEAS
ncbi:hypothetical protein Trisim1_008490 [Trichoderma cf. simile WF8]